MAKIVTNIVKTITARGRVQSIAYIYHYNTCIKLIALKKKNLKNSSQIDALEKNCFKNLRLGQIPVSHSTFRLLKIITFQICSFFLPLLL